MLIFTLVLVFLVIGGSNAIMDVLQFRFDKSVFSRFKGSWWNPSISWKNKWKVENGELLYVNGKPVERFFLSSTLFVFVTDAWHFFKFVMNTSMYYGLYSVLGEVAYYALGARLLILLYAICARSFSFNVLFDRILIRKDK